MDITDMMNGISYGVQKSCAAPDVIFILCHHSHLIQRHPVHEHLLFVVKEYRRDQSLALFLFLLFNHGIVATYGVLFKSSHGTASVQNKNHLC